jgi:hypothetical protein
MLANFLGKSKPINFIILLSLFFSLFLFTSFSLYYGEGFQFSFLFKIASSIGFYLTIFFFYNFIVSKNNLTFDNFYAFSIFTVFLSYFISITTDTKVLITLLLYILFLRKIYSLKSEKKISKKLFDSGFWLGILFILEPFSAIFAILIYAAIFLHQRLIINNLILPIIGFLPPIIIYFTYCFWFDKLYLFTNLFYFQSFDNFHLYSENDFYWTSLVIIILSITSILLKSINVFYVNNSFKKKWSLLVINLATTLFFTLFIPNKNGTEFLFVLFPAAIIIANGLEIVHNNIIKNLFFIFLLISAFIFPVLL